MDMEEIVTEFSPTYVSVSVEYPYDNFFIWQYPPEDRWDDVNFEPKPKKIDWMKEGF